VIILRLRILCRHRNIRQRDDIEDLLRIFLIDSFESNEIYIISPWVSSFKFNRKVIYYPYLSTYSVDEVLKILIDCGVKVNILVRCFDDFISPELIYFLYKVSTGSIKLTLDLLNYLKRELERILYRLNTAKRIEESGVNIRTDLGIGDDMNVWYRLHSKIYINNKYALIGSANFTRGGIVKNGNWECLIKVPSNYPLYKDIVDYAKKYYDHGRDYNECINRVLNIINRYLSPLNIPVRNLDDLKKIISEILSLI